MKYLLVLLLMLIAGLAAYLWVNWEEIKSVWREL
jgi:hypothetical protein